MIVVVTPKLSFLLDLPPHQRQRRLGLTCASLQFIETL